MIDIYTDGSSRGNPGPGGWGIVVIKDNEIIHKDGKQSNKTTNNREELKAIIAALEYAQQNKAESYIINSDSAYCVNIANNWIHTWYANNWKRAKNKEIENLDLIQSLYNYINTNFFKNQIQVKKIKGHAGIEGNELADKIAKGKI